MVTCFLLAVAQLAPWRSAAWALGQISKLSCAWDAAGDLRDRGAAGQWAAGGGGPGWQHVIFTAHFRRLLSPLQAQPQTLDAEGQQDSMPLAEAVQAFAAARRGAAGEASPSERSVSFAGEVHWSPALLTPVDAKVPWLDALLLSRLIWCRSLWHLQTGPDLLRNVMYAGADAATSATQSELDPSDFAAAPSLGGLHASRQGFTTILQHSQHFTACYDRSATVYCADAHAACTAYKAACAVPNGHVASAAATCGPPAAVPLATPSPRRRRRSPRRPGGRRMRRPWSDRTRRHILQMLRVRATLQSRFVLARKIVEAACGCSMLRKLAHVSDADD